ncbi:PP2C family protein-serine/threonine phosphatase [Streptomyces sp. NPDC101118]|uniref:PP2C family protein-serine/threonine phosphatase n=1 Tax=Streptomyces sp. NPDC101118 TaxID=3366109 RepID=UPI0037F95DD0
MDHWTRGGPGRRRAGEGPRHALLAVPFALIALVTVVDVLAPPEVHLGPFLVAAPALTASFAGPRATALVGLVAVLAQVVVSLTRTTLTDLNHTFQITALILISVFVTFFAYLREQHERQVVQLRTVAEAAQQVVLRPLRERLGPLRVASVYLAAEAEARIGGDLYAAARTARGTRFIVGDVRGKGLAAVGDAALVLGAFRAAAHQEADLPALVAYLEGTVAPEPEPEAGGPDGRTGPGPAGVTAGTGGAPNADGADGAEGAEGAADDRGEAFITAAVLDVPDGEHVLHLVNCGHPPPLLLRGGTVTSVDVAEPAPPLGLAEFAPGGYGVQAFAFEPGDLLLLYTDGVIEARDGAGEFYPLAERLAARSGSGPRALLEALRTDLLAHVPGGHLGDDAALVAVARVP